MSSTGKYFFFLNEDNAAYSNSTTTMWDLLIYLSIGLLLENVWVFVELSSEAVEYNGIY